MGICLGNPRGQTHLEWPTLQVQRRESQHCALAQSTQERQPEPLVLDSQASPDAHAAISGVQHHEQLKKQ